MAPMTPGADDDQTREPAAGGSHERWMPPSAAAEGADGASRPVPAVGGVPGGGIVGGQDRPTEMIAAADAAQDPGTSGQGTIHHTPLAPAPEGTPEAAPAAEPPRRRLLGGRRKAAPAPPAGAEGAAAGPERPRRSLAPRRRPPVPPPAEGDAAPAEGEVILDARGRPATAAALRRERKALLERRQEAVYHLGGLAFELYRRDLLREEVMQLRAGELASLDDRVRRIDAVLQDRVERRRTRRTEITGPAGQCLVCRSPFDDGARFCSSCGARLAPDILPPDDAPTGPIPTAAP